MTEVPAFRLTGVAKLANAAGMLDQICEHFVEHADVERSGASAVLRSHGGTASMRLHEAELLIDLACSSQDALEIARTSIAEHMFYFAGTDPLDLAWSKPAARGMPNLHHVTVAGVEDITPRMRRVTFSCADVTPFIGGGMHVRVLVPPKGRDPVWPSYRADGRVAWPEGDDALVVRAYTIRSVDREKREIAIDFFQHAVPGIATPGGDFARDACPGDRLALVGPGSGSLPSADEILLVGDESALPAIARIAAEVPAGTKMRAIVEVEDEAEEQPLHSAGTLELHWLHRSSYPDGTGLLREQALAAIEASAENTYVWAACEKDDIRAIRTLLKQRGHDKKRTYVAWYWERQTPVA